MTSKTNAFWMSNAGYFPNDIIENRSLCAALHCKDFCTRTVSKITLNLYFFSVFDVGNLAIFQIIFIEIDHSDAVQRKILMIFAPALC